MGFAKCVSARNQRYGFFVIHGHATEGFPNIASSCQWVGFAVGTFRIDVDQTHLNRCQRILQFALASVAFVRQPFVFRSPINILLRFPDILSSAGESPSF